MLAFEIVLLLIYAEVYLLTCRECGLNWIVCLSKENIFWQNIFFSFLPSLSFESMLPEANNLFCLAWDKKIHFVNISRRVKWECAENEVSKSFVKQVQILFPRISEVHSQKYQNWSIFSLKHIIDPRMNIIQFLEYNRHAAACGLT